MKNLTLSKREQKLVAVLGLLVLVIGYVYIVYILGPLNRELSKLGARVRDGRQRVNALEAALTNAAALNTQYTQWEGKVKELRLLLPPREDESAMLERLSTLARQSQVKIQAIFPQRTREDADRAAKTAPQGTGKTEPVVYEDVLIQIDASAGYHQLGTFLSLVEAQQYPLRVSSLRIIGNPKQFQRHNVKLVIRAYFSTGAGRGAS